MSAEPLGPLPVDFDLVDRLRVAAIEADDMLMEDVVAILREAAGVIEALREVLHDRSLAAATPAGSA